MSHLSTKRNRLATLRRSIAAEHFSAASPTEIGLRHLLDADAAELELAGFRLQTDAALGAYLERLLDLLAVALAQRDCAHADGDVIHVDRLAVELSLRFAVLDRDFKDVLVG